MGQMICPFVPVCHMTEQHLVAQQKPAPAKYNTCATFHDEWNRLLVRCDIIVRTPREVPWPQSVLRELTPSFAISPKHTGLSYPPRRFSWPAHAVRLCDTTGIRRAARRIVSRCALWHHERRIPGGRRAACWRCRSRWCGRRGVFVFSGQHRSHRCELAWRSHRNGDCSRERGRPGRDPGLPRRRKRPGKPGDSGRPGGPGNTARRPCCRFRPERKRTPGSSKRAYQRLLQRPRPLRHALQRRQRIAHILDLRT